jgi:hypothetical protein
MRKGAARQSGFLIGPNWGRVRWRGGGDFAGAGCADGVDIFDQVAGARASAHHNQRHAVSSLRNRRIGYGIDLKVVVASRASPPGWTGRDARRSTELD